MNRYSRLTLALAAVAALCLLAAGAAPAQDAPPEGQAPAMTPEEQAMMEAWARAATPGEAHAWLARSAGAWKVTGTMQMRADAEPIPIEGTVEREMLHGGRVLVERYRSSFMGQPHEGLGYMGFDNVRAKFWGTWFDNMSTALYISEGECSDDFSRCTYSMTGTDPISGETMSHRIVAEYPDERSERHRFFETHEGEEFQSMEFVYERVE